MLIDRGLGVPFFPQDTRRPGPGGSQDRSPPRAQQLSWAIGQGSSSQRAFMRKKPLWWSDCIWNVVAFFFSPPHVLALGRRCSEVAQAGAPRRAPPGYSPCATHPLPSRAGGRSAGSEPQLSTCSCAAKNRRSHLLQHRESYNNQLHCHCLLQVPWCYWPGRTHARVWSWILA